MIKTRQVGETIDGRSAGVATHEAPPTVGAGIPYIGKLIQLTWLRQRKTVGGEDANDTASTRRRRPDHAPDASRSPIDAGLTRGASLFFGNRR